MLCVSAKRSVRNNEIYIWFFNVQSYQMQSGNFGPIRESRLGCMQGVVPCMKKLHFISLNWRKEK